MTRLLLGFGIKETALVGGSLVLIGIGLIGAAIYPQTFKPDARAHLDRVGIEPRGLRLRLPCSGMTDTGFVVNYRQPGDPLDREGRVCRAFGDGPWTWFPDTNDLRESRVLQ
jgi:hypothetical protein